MKLEKVLLRKGKTLEQKNTRTLVQGDTFAKIFLVAFCALLVILFYKGLITVPNEGDSVDYHIPIAKAVLTGQIFNPSTIHSPSHTRFYPANAESFLSLFILSNIPLGLFNVLGIIFLFFASVKVSRSFKVDTQTSIIFAVSIATLNGVLRWADTQIIDIYLLSFFLLTLSYLENPRKEAFYFIKLGIFTGLLIGTKFSAPFIALALFVVYFNKLLKVLNFKNLAVFVSFVFLTGGFWYLRNYLLAGNPLYPQKFLFFPGLKSTILDVSVLNILTGPISGVVGTLNAVISEYMVWAFIVPITLGFYLWELRNKKNEYPLRLLILSFFVFIFVVNLPSSTQIHIMTSSMRYFLTFFAPLILFSFIYWSKRGYEVLIFISLIVSILYIGFPIGYFPKLLIIAVPICLFIYLRGYKILVLELEKRFKA